MASTITDRRTGVSTAGTTVDRRTGTSGATAVKAPCKAISSSNITLSGEQIVNGVALVDGDRCLVNGQTTQTDNGIYLVSTGTWTRAPDFNDNSDAIKGTIVWVTDGTNSGLYVLTTADDVEIGTDNITFSNITALVDGALLIANNLSDLASAIAAFDNLHGNGADIVASATLNLGAATGDMVDVTGNTGISAVTLAAGKTRLVRFTGTPTITVGASLIGNNGGSNVTMAAGDIALFRGYAAGVVRFWHFPLVGSYKPGGTDVALADGGTGASLADPGADRIPFWDDSAGVVTWLIPTGAPFILGTALHVYETIAIAVSDETTAITTGTAKVTFRMPYAFSLVDVKGSLTTASSSGIPTFDINEGGVSILSTKLTIDANETTSTTAATPAVISDAALAADAEMTIDIDVAGTGAKGAKVYLIGYRTA